MPEVPTMAEAALPYYDMPSWASIMGPAKMQPEHVAILNQAINQALAMPDVRERFQKAGIAGAEHARGAAQTLRALDGDLRQDRQGRGPQASVRIGGDALRLAGMASPCEPSRGTR